MGNLKNNLILIVGILLFVSGFILGNITSNVGRYSYQLYKNSNEVFDSKTGKFYVRSFEGSENTYYIVDIVKAAKKHKNKDEKK